MISALKTVTQRLASPSVFHHSSLSTLPTKQPKMSDQLYLAAAENAHYFKNDQTPTGMALCSGFQSLAAQCQSVSPLLEKIRLEAPKFDLDVETPGNGYRSFLIIFDCLFKQCSILCDSVKKERDNLMFNIYKATYIEDLKSWNEILVALNTFLEHLNTLTEWNEQDQNRCLFPSSAHSSKELLEKAKAIESYSFYGRHAAFQFCPSIQQVLRGLLTIMAGYSDFYFRFELIGIYLLPVFKFY